MALYYGLSLNIFLISVVQLRCSTSNFVISVERLLQHMHIANEAKTKLLELIEFSKIISYKVSITKSVIYLYTGHKQLEN